MKGKIAANLAVWQLVLLGCSLPTAGCNSSKLQEGRATNLARMTVYIEKGEQDSAIRLGLDSLRNEPSDAFVYEQLVIACIKSAQNGQEDQREHRLEQADLYANKALSVDPYDPLDMRNIGGSLVAAGDVSKQKQCSYYKEAQEIYERVTKVLNNKQITMLGKSYPIDPNSRQFEMGGRTFSVESMARDNETAMRNVSVKLKDRCMVSARRRFVAR